MCGLRIVERRLVVKEGQPTVCSGLRHLSVCFAHTRPDKSLAASLPLPATFASRHFNYFKNPYHFIYSLDLLSWELAVALSPVCFYGFNNAKIGDPDLLPFRPSLEEADVIQSQVVAQDFIGKRGSAVNVSTAQNADATYVIRLLSVDATCNLMCGFRKVALRLG